MFMITITKEMCECAKLKVDLDIRDEVMYQFSDDINVEMEIEDNITDDLWAIVGDMVWYQIWNNCYDNNN